MMGWGLFVWLRHRALALPDCVLCFVHVHRWLRFRALHCLFARLLRGLRVRRFSRGLSGVSLVGALMGFSVGVAGAIRLPAPPNCVPRPS